MIDKILEYLPYDFLEGVKSSHLLIAGTSIGVLLFSVYFFTLHQVSSEEMAKLQKQKSQMEQKLESDRRLVAQKDTIAKELARSRGNLDAMKQQLPQEKELPGLLKEVASFGGGRGAFDVTKFQLEEGNIDDFYKKIPVAIQMQGTFWDTLDFLDKMQNRLQLVNFSDLKMNIKEGGSSAGRRGEGGASIPVLHTRLVANTYAYIEGAENNPAGAAINAGNKK